MKTLTPKIVMTSGEKDYNQIERNIVNHAVYEGKTAMKVTTSEYLPIKIKYEDKLAISNTGKC